MKIVNHHAGCCGFYPVRPDGTQWAHVLGLPAGASVHADTAGEILDEVIAGYDNLTSDDARLEARQRHVLTVVPEHQELRIRQAVIDGHADEADPDDAGLIGLLRSVRGQPLGLQNPDAPEATPAWEAPIRLVVTAHVYAPQGELPLPQGNVDVLDPATEAGYLLSLRDAGVLDYWTEDTQPEATVAR